MTPEEARQQPGAFTAFRHVDGSPIYGEYDWIGHDYDCGVDACTEPREVEEVVMVPVRVSTFLCHEEPDVEDDDDEAHT